MKRSLRIRFTLIFTGLTAAILIGIWCVNNWMLESFYVQDKVQTLELAYEQMNIMVMDCLDEGKAIADEFAGSDKLDSGEQTDAVRLLKTLNDKYNIMTVIVDGINDKVIVSSARDAGFMIDKAKKYIIGNDDRRAQIIKQDNNFTIQKTFEPHSRSFYLECWGYYSDNNTIFIMTTPLASIRESVELSNRFLAYVGIAALILGSVIIYFVSKTVTSPILKLSEIAKRMSKLDFEAKYEGHSQDEIGVLGNSVNVLSDRLKEAIGELKSANNQLQKDIEQKVQIDEMRKEFIANVSHELKTVDQFAVSVSAVGINHILHGNKGAQQASQPGGAAGDGVRLQSSQQQHQRIHQIHRVQHQQRGVLFRQQIHHIQPQRQQH